MTSTHTSTQANDDSSCLRRCKHPSQTSKNNDAAFRLCTCCRWELTQRQRRSACKQQAESVGRPDRMRLIKLAIMCLIKLAIATSSRTEVHASYDEHKTVHIAQSVAVSRMADGIPKQRAVYKTAVLVLVHAYVRECAVLTPKGTDQHAT